MLPYINYGLMIWGFKCNRNIKLQKKAIRIICLSKYNSHTESLFKKLKILNVTDMLQLQELKCYYKYVHMKLPAYLQNLPFFLNRNVHNINKRIQDNIHTNRAKHDFAKRCIRYDIPYFETHKEKNFNTAYMDLLGMPKRAFYKTTENSALCQTVALVDGLNN